ncbi:unnamed protein product [Mytilus coruscus]|uniref:Uncharacterized protein n=1 Tax=Mytilus coruscus TaxID=42192 RepID=A0A6J8AFB6_MYTCO|nr:unnamed protein product [Mytilus coruscus]
MLSELCFALFVVILCYITRSSSESLEEDPKLDKFTQHLYQEFHHLSLKKPSNGTGLILPEVLQVKFRRDGLRCHSSCSHIQCCISDTNHELEDYDLLVVMKKPDDKSILNYTSMLSPGYIILSPNHSLHSLPSIICDYPDSAFGAPRAQETIDVMSKSRNFIILLSDTTYGAQEWNKKVWKYAWNYYKWDFNNKRADIDIGAGYLSFDAIIQRCCALNWFPSTLNMEQLNEGHGIAQTLQNHKAKWHKSCGNKFSNLKISRQEKRKHMSEAEDSSNEQTSKITRHSCGESTRATTEGCFFCGDVSDDLHDASTFMIDKRVRECALELQDTVLLAKLSVGDLISQEAKYHAKCLLKLYNKASRQTPKTKKESQESVIHGIVLAELIEYIDGSRSGTHIVPIFKLADLAKLYSKRLDQLGVVIEGRTYTTHLENRILAAIPDLKAHKQGRDVLLIFNEDVGEVLKQATSYSDDEGIIIAKAAQIVRRNMFDTRYSFTGTFNDSCQQESVPQTLVSLVRMILGGPNIETQSSNIVESQTTLTISQLLQFNCAVRRRKDAAATYHTLERKPLLPIYLGMVIHPETRKRDLVDKLYNLGLSISYDRVMNISTAMGNSICERFQNDDVVCPAKLRCDVFTTAAVDNIDHNLAPLQLRVFCMELPFLFSNIRVKTVMVRIKPLPERYSVVPPVILPKESTAIPSVDSPLFSECGFFSGAQQLENRWLNHVRQEIEDDDTDSKNMTWSAFHANLSQTQEVESKQKAFVKQVIKLTATIEEMGNPFLEESEDLLVLDTRDIVDPKVANTVYPPSLSQFGQLILGSKSDLLVPLEKNCVIVTENPDVDAIILDGAVIVNILKPRFCKTFEDYSKQVFLPHINNYLKSCIRLDVIWDEYRQDSLKTSTPGKRGKGIRRRVQADPTIPGNWEPFLRIDDNKTELFAYLAEQLLTLTPSDQTTVVSTKGWEVVCNKPNKNNDDLSPCNHEVADTRIVLHVADAVKNEMQKIMIRTVDTDVVVIAVSAVHKLNITSLWMAFGVGKNFKYIPVHEIALHMGPSKSHALLFFHAFSSCDQVSSFSNRGKKTAWETWSTFDAVTEDFKVLSDKPNEDCLNKSALNIERFVV